MTGPPPIERHQLIPWGEGLDREMGVAVDQNSSFTDLRNLLFLPGSVRLRGGLGTATATIAGETHLCHLAVFRTEAVVIAVCYQSSTRRVSVYKGDLVGQQWTLLSAWGILAASAQTPPQFTTAESYGILILTHDEANVLARLQTYRYDPASATPFAGITADLNNAGAAPVYFRGVTEWLGYAWYWGYGSESDKDRPEIVRVSSAEDPTKLDPQHYFKVGTRDEAVIAISPVRSSLAVLKAGSWHRIDGTDRASWSLRQIDGAVGCVSARAAATIDGRLYWWSREGPRVTDGELTADAGLELDLAGEEPLDLPARGPRTRGYCVYFPDDRHLLFAFPDPSTETQTAGYAVSLRDAGALRWNYWTLGAGTLCAAVVSGDQSTSQIIPPGTASAVITSGSVGLAQPQLTVGWTHNNVVGDEIIELWYQSGAGAWVKLQEAPYGSTSATAPSVTLTHAALVSGPYTVQLRYRRVGRFASGYDGADPSLWPVGSKGNGTIVVVAAPSGVGVTYSFVDGSATVLWTPGDVAQASEVQLVGLNEFSQPISTGAWLPVAAGLGTLLVPWSGGSPQNSARTIVGQLTVNVRHTVGGQPGVVVAGTPVPVNYRAAPDGADCVVDFAEFRASVSLGTGIGFLVTLPSAILGDLSLQVLVNGGTYGTYPPNGGCAAGLSPLQPAGGTPDQFLYSATIPGASPSPWASGYVPSVVCATCLLEGQTLWVGAARATLRWQKPTDYAEHGIIRDLSLPSTGCGP